MAELEEAANHLDKAVAYIKEGLEEPREKGPQHMRTSTFLPDHTLHDHQLRGCVTARLDTRIFWPGRDTLTPAAKLHARAIQLSTKRGSKRHRRYMSSVECFAGTRSETCSCGMSWLTCTISREQKITSGISARNCDLRHGNLNEFPGLPFLFHFEARNRLDLSVLINDCWSLVGL